ncbi:DUF3581 family protein [Celerinatantimonas diazotrophica]|uniref:Uncharacterized protein DUF3581 n=1 Tax=Celerinatantimonas diazotrophica TaxID=412034 RepID=A0A4R1JLV2_9GAMM|nr:DUF3581 family protein [Celerinatantimonas diazotrophica]TCK52042.1 uncharacterized protein DUF3581 [Celerinatantimonas diazotrophica]CAG9296255.1 hypothetical protein CEDIAZO_01403 [Celerinatantimonas diazotrophica]
MFLDQYYQHHPDGVVISPVQASQFAKEICQDFNPIHDPDAKRFCVPGDLLFSMVLQHYGLSQKMQFRFTGMVNEQTRLQLPKATQEQLTITDQHGKSLLEVSFAGKKTYNEAMIEALIRHYGAFSGQNFPTLLMPLLLEHQVMFNPARPLVMYDSMSFELQTLDADNLRIELRETTLDVQGKRADEHLHFAFADGDEVIGKGIKKAILGGLRPYEKAAIEAFADHYEQRRSAQSA